MNKAKVPVVPVGIVGNTEDFLRRAFRGERPLIEMRIGRLFYLDPVETPGVSRHVIRQQQADSVMIRIAALLPAEYRGVYAGYVKDNGKTNQ
jgi:hypothetical protein